MIVANWRRVTTDGLKLTQTVTSNVVVSMCDFVFLEVVKREVALYLYSNNNESIMKLISNNTITILVIYRKRRKLCGDFNRTDRAVRQE